MIPISKFQYVLFTGILTLIFISCKKEKKDEQELCCTNVPIEPINPIIEKKANGFFVMQKFYTIHNNILTLDSNHNRAFEVLRGDPPVNYNFGVLITNNLTKFDTLKLNDVAFRNIANYDLCEYYDTTHSFFAPPRHFKFSADTSFFDNIDFTDSSPLPEYTDFIHLPDSVNFDEDFFVNIGKRNHTKETLIRIFIGPLYSILYSKYLPTNAKSFIIKKEEFLAGAPTKQSVQFEIYLRNWSSITINKREYYFIAEHIYYKK